MPISATREATPVARGLRPRFVSVERAALVFAGHPSLLAEFGGVGAILRFRI